MLIGTVVKQVLLVYDYKSKTWFIFSFSKTYNLAVELIFFHYSCVYWVVLPPYFALRCWYFHILFFRMMDTFIKNMSAQVLQNEIPRLFTACSCCKNFSVETQARVLVSSLKCSRADATHVLQEVIVQDAVPSTNPSQEVLWLSLPSLSASAVHCYPFPTCQH